MFNRSDRQVQKKALRGLFFCYELAIFSFRYSSNSCPECSIRWHVVDAVGQDIRPLEKTFHNACQESYWLKVNRQTHLPV
ncbi:hypothetical protein B6J19_25595 [Klebsiella quasipneumoniae]|nr:hypothetical protein B6J19_25595 [Klebsiella quasipneumoniae]